MIASHRLDKWQRPILEGFTKGVWKSSAWCWHTCEINPVNPCRMLTQTALANVQLKLASYWEARPVISMPQNKKWAVTTIEIIKNCASCFSDVSVAR